VDDGFSFPHHSFQQGPMHASAHPASPAPARPRHPWTSPRVEDLPHLTRLTLQTGDEIPGNCGTGGSGSTCF
jgi:hypothetical protein